MAGQMTPRELADWQARLSALECNHYMFQHQIHCDVHFRVGSEGQMLGAHRYVLESRSDVFTVMFHGPLAEKDVVDVPEVELEDFKEFLRFLYTDDGPIDADSVLVQLYLAKKYNVDTLGRRCVAFLLENLCPDTACFLMEQGHIFNEDGLRKAALAFIQHLLLTIHGSGCYYTYINPQYYDSLIGDFRNEFQGLLTATVQEGTSQHVHQTTLEEMRAKFGDTQADLKCRDKDVFIVEPDLLRCDFESSSRPLCNWHTESPGDLDWEVGQGQTPTILTGPETDHTMLTGAGKYLFIEANNGGNRDFAELVSPLMDAGNGLCLTFWYSMFGTDIGSLHVSVKNGTVTSRTIDVPLWEQAHDQGRGWQLAEVTLPANSSLKAVRFHIRATKGNNIHGDIAIDDISSSPGLCIPTLLNCSFEVEPRLCHWKQTTVFDQLDWTFATRHTLTTSGAGPSHGGWNGNDYLLLDGTHGSPGNTAELQSPEVERQDPLCLHFFYFMAGNGVGELDVILLDRTTDTETTLWSHSRRGAEHLADSWQEARVTVVPPGPFQIYFRATRGSSVFSDIAIDDVGAIAGMCQEASQVVVG